MFGASALAPASPFVAQQGWLVKQGGTRKTWRKRWFVLTDCTLRWYEPGWFTLNPVDGTLKGEVRGAEQAARRRWQQDADARWTCACTSALPHTHSPSITTTISYS